MALGFSIKEAISLSFTRNETGGLVYYCADAFQGADGLLHGFSSRLGGVSRPPLDSLNLGRSRNDDPAAVAENHRRFAAAIGTSGLPLVMCQQIHSDTVKAVTMVDALQELYAPTAFDGDGMVTNTPGLCLMVFYADCIPVLLYDPIARAIGAVHSGWRGTALDIAPKAAKLMGERFGSRPENILAAIGPGIGPCCFETHGDVPQAMEALMGDFVRPFVTALEKPGKFQVDLTAIIARRLALAGLLPENIDQLNLCTACHLDSFWSHRKLGDARGNQAAAIALRPH